MKRTVRVIGRALIPHTAVRPQREALGELCHKARFADAGLAGNQYHLALALPRQLLARSHEFDLCLAADKVNRSPSSRRVEAAMTTAPGSAKFWSRAAMFGVSPTIACSSDAPSLMRSPTTTSPVAMAIL